MFYRGWSGIANIKSENDWHRNLNFLKNNTNLFAQAGIALVVMDCPSDENSVGAGNTPLGCSDDYRSSKKHAEDVRKILALLKEKHGINHFFIMGHSYGAISSKWLARNLGSEIQGSIHSAAQTVASPRMRAYGYSTESFDMSSLKSPVLNIHHGDDQCIYTPYSTVLAYSKNNLITVKDFLFNQFNSSVTKVELKVRNGDSIQRILYDQKISPSEVNNVLNALRREYNIGTLRNDQKVYLIIKREKNGNFVSRLTVNIDNITSVHVFLNKDNVYETKRVTKILTKKKPEISFRLFFQLINYLEAFFWF